MTETLGLGFVAALALLLLDGLLRGQPGASVGERLQLGARIVAFFLLASALATGCRTGDLATDARWVGLFGLCGLGLFELATRAGAALLRGLPAAAQDGDIASATALAAHTLAVGILLANVCSGHDTETLGLAAASFVVGQLTLLALIAVFRRLTVYDDLAEMQRGNLAAAFAHGGLTIALSLVIARATDGPYLGPVAALREYGVALAEGLLVWPLRQLLVQCVLLRHLPTLRGGALDRAIGTHGDVGAGALEGLTYLAVAAFAAALP